MILHGDCLEKLKEMPSDSVDAIVTDPPYGLAFMGKKWDYDVPSVEIWREALRVLKPGGHLLSFGGDRTEHRMKVNIEDAGFEIRTSLAWIYATGFPKSANISKALNAKLPDHERCVCAPSSTRTAPGSQDDCRLEPCSDDGQLLSVADGVQESAPSQADAAERIHGGQRSDDQERAPTHNPDHFSSDHRSIDRSSRHEVRPSEASPACGSTRSGKAASKSRGGSKAARKTAENTPDKSRSGGGSASSSQAPDTWTYHECEQCGKQRFPDGLGTALKPAMEIICLARKPLIGTVADNVQKYGTGGLNIDGCRIEGRWTTWQAVDGKPIPANKPAQNSVGWGNGFVSEQHPQGRWPANVLFDEEAAAVLDGQSGVRKSGPNPKRRIAPIGYGGSGSGQEECTPARGADSGTASRFFFVCKPSRRERNAGCEELEERTVKTGLEGGAMLEGQRDRSVTTAKNHHPTVKPVQLMRYLCRLVCPPNGTIIDPFAGSGTTGVAAKAEGFNFIGIEREAEYVAIAQARLA